MNVFGRILYLPFVVSKIVLDMHKQKRFLQKHIQPIIHEFRIKNDGTVNEEDFRKILKYYGFGVPAVLAESYATLRGHKLSYDERLASTYQGAATGFFDDFFDKKEISEQRILELLQNPEIQAKNTIEELSLFFYKSFLKLAYDKDFVTSTIQKIHMNQLDSKKQKLQDITYDEILNITNQKGGNSVLFYRALIAPEINIEEEKALYQMGVAMQMGNDIFDVFKDAQDKIRTIITTASDIETVKSEFSINLAKALQLLDNLDFKSINKRKVILKLLLSISRVFVALDQFDKLQKQTENTFNPHLYTRAQLICDMEKPLNIIKSLRYYFTFQWKSKLEL